MLLFKRVNNLKNDNDKNSINLTFIQIIVFMSKNHRKKCFVPFILLR